VGVVVVKFTDAIARVLKGVKIRAGRGASFGAGVAAPLVTLLPVVRSRAPTSLSRGGRNHRVVAAPSIPQGVCSLHHGCGCLAVASPYCFSHGRRQTNKEHGQEKIQVRGNSWREMLFELPHENGGLEALHFHEEAEQFEIRLPLALSELSRQSFYQAVKRIIRIIADM
jgi:hypothetical protein